MIPLTPDGKVDRSKWPATAPWTANQNLAKQRDSLADALDIALAALRDLAVPLVFPAETTVRQADKRVCEIAYEALRQIEAIVAHQDEKK